MTLNYWDGCNLIVRCALIVLDRTTVWISLWEEKSLLLFRALMNSLTCWFSSVDRANRNTRSRQPNGNRAPGWRRGWRPPQQTRPVHQQSCGTWSRRRHCAFGVYPLTPTASDNNQFKVFQNQIHTVSVHWSGTFPLLFNRFCVRGIRMFK